MSTNKYRSYIKYYWISWILLFSLLFFVKFLHVPVLKNIDIGIAYFIYWLMVMLVWSFENYRLMNYLQEHHFKKWEELTRVTVWGHEIYMFNSFKLFPFMRSSDNLDDEYITFLKLNGRKLFIFTVVVFICFLPFSIISYMIV